MAHAGMRHSAETLGWRERSTALLRRAWLILLMSVEALFWLATVGTPAGRFDPRPYAVTPGAVQWMLVVLQVALMVAPAIVIGALSRTWQGAVALNLIASLPAVLLVGLWRANPYNMEASMLGLMAPLAAFGLFGWLLRFVRAEFTV
jgi:hypothetical protein